MTTKQEAMEWAEDLTEDFLSLMDERCIKTLARIVREQDVEIAELKTKLAVYESWGDTEKTCGELSCDECNDRYLVLRAKLKASETIVALKDAQLLSVSSCLCGDDKGEDAAHPRWTPCLDAARVIVAGVENIDSAVDAERRHLDTITALKAELELAKEILAAWEAGQMPNCEVCYDKVAHKRLEAEKRALETALKFACQKIEGRNPAGWPLERLLEVLNGGYDAANQ